MGTCVQEAVFSMRYVPTLHKKATIRVDSQSWLGIATVRKRKSAAVQWGRDHRSRRTSMVSSRNLATGPSNDWRRYNRKIVYDVVNCRVGYNSGTVTAICSYRVIEVQWIKLLFQTPRSCSFLRVLTVVYGTRITGSLDSVQLLNTWIPVTGAQ